MTSVVDTSVKHFHSAMVGAPILNGQAGSMIALLNACLKDGFDIKAATSLTVDSGVATLAFTGSHSATVESVVLVAGSSVADLNGEQKITAIGVGFVKFATAAADGAATGSISFKMAPAGWTQPFTGTNIATYKSADPMSTGMILRVDDPGTLNCRVVGYEQMSDVNTGTGAFPTTAQMSGGGYWAKSAVASATAVSWVLATDGRKIILHVAYYLSANAAYLGGVTRGFGDDIPLRPGGDPYACSLNYSAVSSSSGQQDAALDYNNSAQCAMPRSYTGLGSSVLHAPVPYTGYSGALSGADATMGAFPSPIDGGLRLSKKFLATAAGSAPPRSDLPGLYSVPMSLTYDYFKTRDVIAGTGVLGGRRLIALSCTNSMGSTGSSAVGVSFVDITGPWR